MKLKLFVLLMLTVSIVSSCSYQGSKDLRDEFLLEKEDTINKMVLRSLDHPYSYPDVELTDPNKISELWSYLSSLKARKSKSFETYTEPINEWELIIFHDKGDEILQILHQGSILNKEGQIYIITESNVDIAYIVQLFK